MKFNKKTGVSLVSAFMLLVSSMAVTANAENFPFVGEVNATNVNIRATASMSGAVHSTVSKGVTLDVFAREGDWYKIGTAPGSYAYISAQFVSFKPFVGVVTANDVNVRTAPSLNATVHSKVNKGVTVDVFASEGDWYKIGTAPGSYGYISAQYVSSGVQAPKTANVTASRGEAASGAMKAVELTKTFLGVPYVYGGTSPSGFDCSGLVYYVYKQLGYSLNRTADGMSANGVPVEKANLLPGDIILFKRPGNNYVHHVGLYVGDGQMIHAPQTGDVVKYTSITSGYYNDVYYSARRIIR